MGKVCFAIALAFAFGVRGEDVGEAVRRVFAEYETAKDLPGAASVVVERDGRENFACCGFADIATGRKVGPDSLFWIASNTKALAAATVLTLVDEGRIALDDTVDRYLPEFARLEVEDAQAPGGKRPAKRAPTVRELLSHTAGLRFVADHPIDQWPMRLLASKAATTPQLADPGTIYRYSNWGIDVAAAVAEVVTGTTWDRLLDERILKPLGMDDTTFFPTEGQLSRLAVAYRIAEDRPPEPQDVVQFQRPYSSHTRYPEAGGGLFSTPRDLVRFFRMLAMRGVAPDGRRILSERMIDELARKQTPPSVDVSYSFGLKVTGSRIGHGGAYHTYGEADLATGVARVYLVQIGSEETGRSKRRYADWMKASAVSGDGEIVTEGQRTR